MIKLDWILRKTGERSGFDDLVKTLAFAPKSNVLSTHLVMTLVEDFYPKYHRKVILHLFLPFLIYFSFTVYLLSENLIHNQSPDKLISFQNFALALMVIGWIYFLLILILQFLDRTRRKRWRKSSFVTMLLKNHTPEIASLTLNAVFLIDQWRQQIGKD